MRVKGTLDVKASVKLGSLHMQARGSLEHSQVSCVDKVLAQTVCASLQ